MWETNEGIKVLNVPKKIGHQENDQTMERTLYIFLYKKGDAREYASNRTIARLSHCSKVLKLVHSRIKEWTEQIMPYVHGGFEKEERPEIKSLMSGGSRKSNR